LKGGTNTYAYVTNNPINLIDPGGLSGVAMEFGGSYLTGWGGPTNDRLPIQQGGSAASGGYHGFNSQGKYEAGLFTSTSTTTDTGSTPAALVGLGFGFTYYAGDAQTFIGGTNDFKSWTFGPWSMTIYYDKDGDAIGLGSSFGKGMGWAYGQKGLSKGNTCPTK